MRKQFEINITKNTLFNKTDKLLLAFSGGVDSVVLADLLNTLGYQFELAHCNFQLRGAEAIDDTKFCETFANRIQKPIHITYFDTKQYAQTHKLSIQMAARELRYQWFNQLINEFKFAYVLTAHHANDTVETLFVNLIRGSGIKGLQGIPEKQNDVVRPLLFATKDEIKKYAAFHKLEYREDSSNQEVKYKRNFIRHEVIPKLKMLNPAFEETIKTSTHFFKQASDIVSAFAQLKYQQICTEENYQLQICIALLKLEPQKETLLYEWLSVKGFKNSQIQQLSEALLAANHVGKLFSSATHQLVIDREFMFVKPIVIDEKSVSYTIQSADDVGHLPIKLSMIETTQLVDSTDKNTIYLAYSDDLFPLTLRKWKQGDKFQPFGMKGFKKLSDFFKDQKLSRFQKDDIWILENNQHIIWIVGYRLDERCRVTNKSEAMVKVSIN